MSRNRTRGREEAYMLDSRSNRQEKVRKIKPQDDQSVLQLAIPFTYYFINERSILNFVCINFKGQLRITYPSHYICIWIPIVEISN